MRKKSQKAVCALLLTMTIALAIGCAVKDHELTTEELAAAETTRALKAGKETTEPTTEEEKDAEPSVADAFISEVPDVYEDYQAPETEPAQEPEPEQEPEVHYDPTHSARGYEFTSDEVWEMTRIVYLENGITYPECTYNTVYLTACVILNRLYDWDECSTVYDVIWEPGQYSTADRYHDYNGAELGTSNPEGWEISATAVWDAMENCDRHPHFQSMGAQGEVYYVDPVTGETFCY